MLDAVFAKDITDLLIKYRGVQSSIDSTKNSISEIDGKIKELECEKNTLKLCKPIIDDIISKFSELIPQKIGKIMDERFKENLF